MYLIPIWHRRRYPRDVSTPGHAIPTFTECHDISRLVLIAWFPRRELGFTTGESRCGTVVNVVIGLFDIAKVTESMCGEVFNLSYQLFHCECALFSVGVECFSASFHNMNRVLPIIPAYLQTLNQCRYNVGPASQTVCQHWDSVSYILCQTCK